MKKYIVFGSPNIGNEEKKEVLDSLNSSWIGSGPKKYLFEKNFSKYKKINYSVALNSCTASLHLSILSLDLKKGDEIITPAMTFCSTINSIIHSGATPVLADVDLQTMNIDPDDIERKITKRTKCIIPVHFAGRPCEMDKIQKIANKYKLKIIEDCAHAVETKYKNKNAGTFGDLGCFSFYATKNLTTGEGGMVITNNKKYADKIKIKALHGLSQDAWKRYSDSGFKHYYVTELGFKYNMPDLQASIGIHQLKNIEKNWKIRKKIWDIYNYNFKNLPLVLPSKVSKGHRHAYHLYTLQIDKKKTGFNRDEFIQKLHNKNIGTGVHYLSIPEHPYYKKKYKWKIKDYPNSLKIGRQTVSLPLSSKLSSNEIKYIVNNVKELFK